MAAAKRDLAAARRREAEVERQHRALRQERRDFEKWRADEEARLKGWREEEARKLQKQRSVMERQAKAMFRPPDRKCALLALLAAVHTLRATLTCLLCRHMCSVRQ
ncbi:MAG: hypothetical protein ACK4ZJ_20240, partial [Allorhizobium sp.]